MIRRLSALLLIAAAGCTSLPNSYNPPGPPDVELVADQPTTSRTYYVDQRIGRNPCTQYDPRSQACGSGRELAFNNLTDANGLAQAGDTILVRAGTYAEQIAPSRSGTPRAPIVYRRYGDDAVQIVTLQAPAIWLIGTHYIHVKGFVIRDSQGWGRLENAHHNLIEDNDFREALARGTTGGLKLVQSHFNIVRGNTFYRGNDSIVVQTSDRNRIVDNHFEFARHSLFSIRCGNFNILRNNYLHNERQKIGEIYDCEGISDAPFVLDATKRNLVEGNHFAFSRGADQPTRYNGIQFSGQLGLIRHNLFKRNEGGAIHFAVYSDEALNTYGNRVVGNWFFDNRCYAVSGSTAGGIRVGDNRVIGNLLSGNVDCLGYKNSVMRAPLFDMVDNEEAPAPIQGLPRVWHTRTMSAGAGRSIPVDDVLPFFDGYGLAGERGDAVQVESTGADAFVIGIDYENRQLLLDRDLTWEGGDGVRILETLAREPFTVMPSSRVVRVEE